jgi:16S rRNA (cytosine967-C5)-methyltransferase
VVVKAAGGARDLAARVVERVTKQEAFAAATLEAELGRAVQLDARDRGLATELVYGTLRVLPWLKGEIARFAPRGIDSLDARVQARLAVAAYQLFFTRVPPFAAVSEAVEAIRVERSDKLGGFANAVLRKVAARAASSKGDVRQEALLASTPKWLRAALERAIGSEGANAYLGSGAQAAPIGLRVEDAAQRDAWIAKLRQAAPEATFEPGRVSPRAILVRGAGRVQGLPGWSDGSWAIQEEGSQLAAMAVGAREGERVLDACAGRGNKTGVLARAVGPAGAVDACDTSPSKLERLQQELGRIGLRASSTFAVDWSVGSGDVTGTYDRVLVDAPCTGVGTLRRRPEILLRLTESDLVTRPAAQVAIASRAAEHVRPGGTLVYVVCSVLREEAEEVVSALCTARPELVPTPFDAPEARPLADGGASLRLLPHVHGTDGYFVAAFVRR